MNVVLPRKSRTALMLLWLLLLLSACAVARTEPVTRLALLAPFEGRYREVGYNALYAARLALNEGGFTDIELLAVDDGGTASSAEDRARALAIDPLVSAALVLGYAAADADTLAAFDNVPVIVVGSWGAQPREKQVFILASESLREMLSVNPTIDVTDAARAPAPLTGGEVFALAQFARLRPALEGVSIASSARLPDAAFRERYINSAEFAPEPGLLAPLVYDATHLAAEAMRASAERENVRARIAHSRYDGLNGPIAFKNGYWEAAPIHLYGYADGKLTPINDVIE